MKDIASWWGNWWARRSSSKRPAPEVWAGRGGHPPAQELELAGPLDFGRPDVACTGPGAGITELPACAEALPGVAFGAPSDWAYGRATSMYDALSSDPSLGRAGDPIADCFALLCGRQGGGSGGGGAALLALADGVNWGQPARRAATAAVMASVAHLAAALPALPRAAGSGGGGGAAAASSCGDDSGVVSSTAVFRSMLDALGPAQAAVLSNGGTMTTLVVTVVVRLRAPVRGRPRGSGGGGMFSWAALTVAVGDSPAYVWRRRTGAVQELSAAVHSGTFRDPRWTPGALGCARGDEPDLDNLACSLTLLDRHDVVFLASDGVADNFDPFVLRLARQATPAEVTWTTAKGGGGGGDRDSSGSGNEEDAPPPAMTPEEAHALQLRLLADTLRPTAISTRSSGGIATAVFLQLSLRMSPFLLWSLWPWKAAAHSCGVGDGSGSRGAGDGSGSRGAGDGSGSRGAGDGSGSRGDGDRSGSRGAGEGGEGSAHSGVSAGSLRSPRKAPSRGPPLSAECLVERLLWQVEAATAEQRAWAEARGQRKAEGGRPAAARPSANGEDTCDGGNGAGEEPSLSTDRRQRRRRLLMPPGKMDHTTAVAVVVGGGGGGGGASAGGTPRSARGPS